MRNNLLALFLFGLIIPVNAVTISGTVKNNKGKNLVGANVYVEGTALGAATDASGFFEIKKIPTGRTYEISAMYIGHRKVTKEIVTKEGGDVKIDFELVMSLVDLVFLP